MINDIDLFGINAEHFVKPNLYNNLRQLNKFKSNPTLKDFLKLYRNKKYEKFKHDNIKQKDFLFMFFNKRDLHVSILDFIINNQDKCNVILRESITLLSKKKNHNSS